MPKSKKETAAPSTASARAKEITSGSSLAEILEELVGFATGKQFHEPLLAAREWFFIRPATMLGQLPEYLERLFLEWFIFDHRPRREEPTLFERFVKSRSFDSETKNALLKLGDATEGFYRILEGKEEKGTEVRLSLVELGRETEGRIEVLTPIEVPHDEDRILEGRVVEWQGERAFLGSVRVMNTELAAATVGDIRSLRQRYAEPALWTGVLTDVKPLLFQDSGIHADEVTGIIKRYIDDAIPLEQFSIRRIMTFLQYDRHETATEWARELTEDIPASVPARIAYALCLQRVDRSDEALAILSECRSREPDDVNLMLLSAAILCRLERFTEASRVLNPALEMKGSERYPEVLGRAGLCDYSTGNRDHGRALMLEALERDMSEVALSMEIIMALLKGDEPAEAVKFGERAAKIDDENTSIWLLLSNCYEGVGEDGKALAQLDRFVRTLRQPAPDLQRRMGFLASRLGRYTRAACSFESCLDADQQDVEAACGLVEVLRKRGRDHQAEPIWERYRQQFPDHPAVLRLMNEGQSA